ncbi:MAG: xanthine dehydrogenase family protein molybdopterin-binding subunit [Gammaproteobacteria bacterium]|nr:xanthine dehydrogenase family protein molybdopterin-binding subunit [Gammaproteobacteria bacterium]
MSKTTPDNGFNVVGTSPLRPDGLDKVTGRAQFADDFHLPDMLHGKILRSPHAHARILSIDTRAAAALPGVRAVVTGADFPAVRHELLNQGAAGVLNIREMSENCMARDKALYDGHAVAAVAADNPHDAELATNLIQVEYELLPPVMNVCAAMADDAPVIHENFHPGAFIAPTEKYLPNASRIQLGNGDPAQGFAEADLVLEREYTSETIHQGYIESHITTVIWDSNDYVTVWTATQGQFALRDHLADIIQVPLSNINVVPLEIGGGFGGKERLYIDPVAALLAKKAQRPVKIAMRRDEVFRATGPSSGTYIKLKFGVKRDGALTAAHLHLAYEAGAYAGGPLFLAIMSATSRYNIPNIHIDGFDVIVNKPTMRPYRAPGAPQALFAVEQMVDELAHELEMDPIEFRMQNLMRSGDRLVPGLPLAPIDTEKMLETVQAHPHYQAPLEGPHRGRGLAYSIWFNIGEISSAHIQVNPDGSVALTTASPDLSGTRISLAMQAAEMLGIDVEQVSATVSDTRSIGFSLPSVGSRTTYSTGAVVCEVAQEILQQMCARAALLWETQADQVSVQNGVFSNQTDPGQTMTFNDLAARMFETGGPISYHKTGHTQSFIPGTAAHLVDVKVDPETGKVDILRYTIFQDVGKAVHPDYVEGQMQGATVQGIGMALNEEYCYDKNGCLQNASLLDYRLPTSLDVPMLETVILESPNPAHPFGVRGCGEISIAPPPAAIANAIYDAVGVRLHSMPMSPHKVCAAIREQHQVNMDAQERPSKPS